jgi:dipeptidyl aminopeptidase/acylaminoacyl peptidase
VAFSPDGARIAWTWLDTNIRVWDAAGGKLQLLLSGHDAEVCCAAFSPDGTRIASAAEDKTLRLWNAITGEPLLVLRGHEDGVHSVAFSPDGTRIASGSQDKTIRVWSAQTGESLLVLRGHAEDVGGLCYSPDGARIASASDDNTVRVWDARSGQELLVLRGHVETVHSLAFSPDGKRIASASHDKTVRIWDAASGESLLVLRGHRDGVYAVAFSPDGTRIASASSDSTVRVWETSPSVAHDPSREAVAAATKLVSALFDPLTLVEDVVQRLQADTSLRDDVRAIAIRLARVHGDVPETLNTASWFVVRRPRGDPNAYVRAARAARVACDRQPGDGSLLNTLGVAEYRLGLFEQALATLTHSDELNGHKQPGDVAFLAMANHELGHAEAAQAALARLRELLKSPDWSADAEAALLSGEAEALLAGAK